MATVAALGPPEPSGPTEAATGHRQNQRPGTPQTATGLVAVSASVWRCPRMPARRSSGGGDRIRPRLTQTRKRPSLPLLVVRFRTWTISGSQKAAEIVRVKCWDFGSHEIGIGASW